MRPSRSVSPTVELFEGRCLLSGLAPHVQVHVAAMIWPPFTPAPPPPSDGDGDADDPIPAPEAPPPAGFPDGIPYPPISGPIGPGSLTLDTNMPETGHLNPIIIAPVTTPSPLNPPVLPT